MMFTESAVRSDHESRLYFFIIDDLDVFGLDSRIVKDNLLGVTKTVARHRNFHLTTRLPPAGNGITKVWGSGFQQAP